MDVESDGDSVFIEKRGRPKGVNPSWKKLGRKTAKEKLKEKEK